MKTPSASNAPAVIPGSTPETADQPGARYALGVLCIVAVFSLLDRQLVTIIVGPLKQEFRLTDTMFSFLQGYSFALPYALLGLPFGRLVDRYSRRNLVLAGLVMWSALTIASGFAWNFTQLLIFRAGVGIGEAVLAPAAYSLLADFFRPSRRGRAIGVYYVAMSIGGGGSLIVGGVLLQLIPSTGVAIPGWGELSPWRMLFVITGLPGLLVGLLVLSVGEPTRGPSFGQQRATLRELGSFIWNSRASLWRISAMSVLVTLAGYSSGSWAPAYFDREFGVPASQMAVPIGLAMIVGAFLGPFVSGWLTDHWTKEGLSDPRVRVMPLGFLVLVPGAFWSLMPSVWLAMVLFTLVIVSVAIVQTAMPLAFQEATPIHMRGQVLAIQLTILGLLSIGLGPTLVALVTDVIYRSDDMLAWSIVTVMVPLTFIGLWVSISSYRRIRSGDAPVA